MRPPAPARRWAWCVPGCWPNWSPDGSQIAFDAPSASLLRATLINGATNVDMTKPVQWTAVANVQAYTWPQMGNARHFSMPEGESENGEGD